MGKQERFKHIGEKIDFPGPGQYLIPSMMDLMERKNKMLGGKSKPVKNNAEVISEHPDRDISIGDINDMQDIMS